MIRPALATPGRAATLAHRLVPQLVGRHATERPITVDQTNYSVVVAEAVVVKWLLPPVAEPYGAVRQLEHLRAVGFEDMPDFYAAFVEHGRVSAMLTRFVPGASDGWDWYVEEVITALEQADVTAPIRSARRAGDLAARLTKALATPSAVAACPVVDGSMASEAQRGLVLLDEAIASTAGGPGRRLAARAPRLRQLIETLAQDHSVETQWVHGDFHVGQLLRAADRILINDFDGSPVEQPSDRHALRTPLVDLASLLQSIDHVGRVVARRRPDLSAGVRNFIGTALPAAQAAYSQVRPVSGADLGRLAALRAIQELHEFVYAARSLPAWLYVPDAALQAMLPAQSDPG